MTWPPTLLEILIALGGVVVGVLLSEWRGARRLPPRGLPFDPRGLR
jgi:hypothetical protein